MQNLHYIIIIFLFFSITKLNAVTSFKIPYYQQFFDLNPQVLKSSSGQYFYQNLYANLLRYNNQRGLIPDLAEKCFWKEKKTYSCLLDPKAKWSDGSPISVDDFKKSYIEFLKKNNNYPRKDFLFPIINAQNFSEGKVSWEKVGIKTNAKKNTIDFFLNQETVDFPYALIQAMTVPIKNLPSINKAKELISSGAYRIKSFSFSDQKIVFEINPFYHRLSTQASKRDIEIEWIYLTEDSLQLPLYEKKELDIVRRLPTSAFKDWKNKKDFILQEILRFDYFGFNLSQTTKYQRELLFSSLPLDELKSILSSRGRPGCFQFDQELIIEKELCYPIISSTQPTSKTIFIDLKGDLTLSQAGGEDHQKVAEWLQNQWQKKLNFSINIKILENKIFMQNLKQHLPLIYRKGVPMETASCLAALKIFEVDSPENLNHIDNKDLNQIIKKLKKEISEEKKRKLCSEGLKIIMKEFYLVPTGKFDLAYLINPNFVGYEFNKLNYLSLRDLEIIKIKNP
ncbi:MAG: hypothetical protein HUU56_06060 [Bdellovibrionaceae bacterium]|nr:hypothetical protein [Pseudobdellovibrionaceae bacterium]